MRVEDFTRQVVSYGRDRNQVVENHSNVSRLSPWIRCRLISEYEVVQRILSEHGFSTVEKFIQEVYWRIYWKGWLEMRPQIWSDYRTSLEEKRSSLSPEDQQTLEALEAGDDRCPLMARFSRELTRTGYLHNHVRMWFAGYWVHSLGLPWECGADFFYRHLLDADPASNTLSWRWVAGLQTPGKSYQAHASNIRKFCRYPEASDPHLDEHLELRGDVPPVDRDGIPAQEPVWESFHRPVINEPYLLWIHGEDLSFWRETGTMPERGPERAVAIVDPLLTKRFRMSPVREQFLNGALSDALQAFNKATGIPSELARGNLAEEMVRRARESGCGVIAGMLPPVGPLRDALCELRQRLDADGVRFVLWRREKDEELMPLARRGFFSFWNDVRKQESF